MQYTHDDPGHGSLLRVLPGAFTKRPESFSELVRQTELYFLFLPVRYAVRKQVAEIAAYEQEIPDRVRPFPLILDAGQRALSIVELTSYQTILERLETGWLPSTDASYKY